MIKKKEKEEEIEFSTDLLVGMQDNFKLIIKELVKKEL